MLSLPARWPGRRASAGAAVALALAVTAIVIGLQVVDHLRSPREGGPLQLSGGLVPVSLVVPGQAPASYTAIAIGNAGATARITRIRLLSPRGARLIGARLEPLPAGTSAELVAGFPPAGAATVALATPIANSLTTSTLLGPQPVVRLVVGVSFSRPEASFEGVWIEYRAGSTRYVRRAFNVVTLCRPRPEPMSCPN